ncbi:MAG: NUDIX hydrolase [Candidatus Paceibacterota bacterium]
MNTKEKSNMLAVSIIITNDEGQVLLRKRVKSPDEGKWELFASYPYLDELPLEKAVKRVLKEKAGIDEVSSLQFSGKFYDESGRHPGQACVPLIFIAKVGKDIVTSEDRKWFSPSEMKNLPMAFDNKTSLEDLGFVK